MSNETTLVLHKKDKPLGLANEDGLTSSRITHGHSFISHVGGDDIAGPVLTEVQSHTEREMIHVILDGNLADSDTSSSESDNRDKYLEERTTLNTDFLETFSGVPSIDAISAGTARGRSISHTSKDLLGQPSMYEDEGTFVDPLTGEVIKDKTDEDEWDEEEEEQMQEEISEESLPPAEVDFMFSEDDDLLALLETPEQEFEVKLIDETGALDDFLMVDTNLEEIPSKTAEQKEALEQERMRKILIEETAIFLTKLIQDVVQKAEYKDPNTILRKNLDKYVLMEEICKKLDELETERKARYYLNRRVVEFFKRKKSFHAITELSDIEDAQCKAKYKEAIKKLDHVLALEVYIKEKYEVISKNLREKRVGIQQENIEIEKQLETLIRGTLVKSANQRLALAVNELLEDLNNSRKLVSDRRLKLIQIQHTKAVLQKKIDDFENQFRVREYMALQTEATELDKKIEERNADLEVSRRRCNTDIHAFSHTREKVDILRLYTQMRKRALAKLQSTKKIVRERLIHLKVERTYLQKEIRELTVQTGLLSKPSLLQDYDYTLDQVQETKNRIKYLRQQRSELIDKIEKMEQKYTKGMMQSRNTFKIT